MIIRHFIIIIIIIIQSVSEGEQMEEVKFTKE